MKIRFLPVSATTWHRWTRPTLLVIGGAVLCAVGLPACVGPDGVPRDNTAMLPEDQRVSSVPWNKPQGWENSSQLGALANNPRIGGQQ